MRLLLTALLAAASAVDLGKTTYNLNLIVEAGKTTYEKTRDDAEALFAEMRRFFDDAQLVEIGFVVTTLHGMNQFNNMFGIEPEDRPMESLTGLADAQAAD